MQEYEVLSNGELKINVVSFIMNETMPKRAPTYKRLYKLVELQSMNEDALIALFNKCLSKVK
jgi:hypothetical protein